MKELKFYPEEKDEGTRIDIYLADAMNETRSRVKNLVAEGCVTYNKEVLNKCGVWIKNGGEIEVCYEDIESLSAEPEDIPLDIVYQDSDIAVINKRQGMVTHPAVGSPNHTLVNALLFHIKDLSGIYGVLRPGIVHRLDKDTSGLLVIAKNNEAHRILAGQIASKEAGRHYLALVHGNIVENIGKIDKPIGRSNVDRKKMTITEAGRSAVTNYFVRERFNNYTLVEFVLGTGRTHQIRVHAKYMQHPVVGDPVYGIRDDSFNLKGQLLHAYKLSLIHPSTLERMEFYAPLPDYFEKVLEELRAKNS